MNQRDISIPVVDGAALSQPWPSFLVPPGMASLSTTYRIPRNETRRRTEMSSAFPSFVGSSMQGFVGPTYGWASDAIQAEMSSGYPSFGGFGAQDFAGSNYERAPGTTQVETPSISTSFGGFSMRGFVGAIGEWTPDATQAEMSSAYPFFGEG